MSDTPAIDPKRTAVVLIEYQNDFATEGGTLHGAVKDVMESTVEVHDKGANHFWTESAKQRCQPLLDRPTKVPTTFRPFRHHPGVVQPSGDFRASGGCCTVPLNRVRQENRRCVARLVPRGFAFSWRYFRC